MIASYYQALKFKPDKHEAWYNKACSYALQGKIELALENLQQAINLSPDDVVNGQKPTLILITFGKMSALKL
ncbi:MAG: tetratricopeptide repeat protein [Nostoc sp.]